MIPNPFDIGSAKYLASLGFPALASTSAGMAFAAGKGDGAVDRAYTLSHLRDLAEATDLPLNADFEAGFARDAEGVHESARLCVGAGVSGFSIEDYTGDPKAPLYGLSEATDRLRAARAAINASGEKVLLTARSEAILRQAGGLPEALRRLEAYAEAGADVLYAPLVRTPEEVAEVVRVAGKLPVNVLAGWPGFTKTPARGSRRQTDQRRGRARPRRLGRVHASGEGHRRARPVRRLRRPADDERDHRRVRGQGLKVSVYGGGYITEIF